MSLAKLGVDGAGYYLDQVAAGAEEYYTGAGEAPGVWLGSGGSGLRLAGRVDADDLRAVLSGVAPRSGEQLASGNRRVPGFDLTFSAPKSVSLVYALGGREAGEAVVAAHETAVAAAVGYLEREACWTRRGHNGVDRERAAGFVAAGFRHRTSRAGDPQLHTHVLVANLAQRDDGRWRTLDGRHLYRHQRTAGFLYQAQLRAELNRTLGVGWEPARCGMAEIAGVPEHVLRVFSRRRQQIVEHLHRRHHHGARAGEIAALETRHAKQSLDLRALHADWVERDRQAGIGPRRWRDLLTAGRKQRRRRARTVNTSTVPAGVLGARLTEKDSTFARRDLVRAVAEAATSGADVATVEAATDRLLTGVGVVKLAEDLYSTREHLEMERRLLDGASARRGAGVGVVTESVIDDVLDRAQGLSEEQQAMVRHVTTSGQGVDVVIGHPGSGKTTALAAAGTAWREAGHQVIGAALAARAAQELQTATRIPSHTLASLLGSLEREQLPAGSVVIVDEAGMVGTRILATLLDHAQAAQAKVVLVGDPKQLPEIDAGGAFRALARDLDAARLTSNRRQRDPVERKALADLRAGRIDRAMERMNAHGRITHAPDFHAACQQMITDWQTARAGGDQVLLLAARRTDVDYLNELAQAARLQARELSPESKTYGRVAVHVGDTVMALRNDYRTGILNGQRGTVTALHDEGVTIDTETGNCVELHRRMLERDVQLGYAVTIHKSQGTTTDRSLVLATDDLGYEAGYTALTRGRHENHLYITEPLGVLDEIRYLRRSTAKHLAQDRGTWTDGP